MIKHLPTGAVLAIHEQVMLAHYDGLSLRGRALLASAVASPKATFSGEAIISDGVELAAAYSFFICENNPFIDSNRRTALASCLVLLSEHSQLENIHLDVDAWEAFFSNLASSDLGRNNVMSLLRLLVNES